MMRTDARDTDCEDVGKLREDSAGSVAALDDDAGAGADAADVCSVQCSQLFF